MTNENNEILIAIEKLNKRVDKLIEMQESLHKDVMLGLKAIRFENAQSGKTRPPSENTETDDEMYEKAKEFIIGYQKASTSLLQRKFAIGYSRACKLMDMLEEKGVVGPVKGIKPREVLISKKK